MAVVDEHRAVSEVTVILVHASGFEERRSIPADAARSCSSVSMWKGEPTVVRDLDEAFTTYPADILRKCRDMPGLRPSGREVLFVRDGVRSGTPVFREVAP